MEPSFYLKDDPPSHLYHTSDIDPEGWKDRAIGCLVGLAVGDAVGIALEFASRPSTEEEIVSDMEGNNDLYITHWAGETTGCLPGEWSDDTSMALALGESLINNNKFVPHDVMDKWVAWAEWGYLGSRNFRPNRPEILRNEPAFDIGTTIQKSLDHYIRSNRRCIFAGKKMYQSNPTSCVPSNGSIMRLAPIVLFSSEMARGEEGKAVYELARLQSELTHGHPAAGDASQILSHILGLAISGKPKKSVLMGEGFDFTLFSDTDDSNRIRKLFDIDAPWMKKRRSQLIPYHGHIGSAEYAMESSLWSILKTTNFKDAILMGINLGGDADTIGAITGQIAGAMYGNSSIPEEWRHKLVRYGDIVDLSNKIIQAGEKSNKISKLDGTSEDTEAAYIFTMPMKASTRKIYSYCSCYLL